MHPKASAFSLLLHCLTREINHGEEIELLFPSAWITMDLRLSKPIVQLLSQSESHANHLSIYDYVYAMRAITRLHDTKCAGSKFLIKTTVAMGVASKRAAIMEFMKCVFHYVRTPQLGQKPRKVPTMRFVAHRPHKRS